MHDEGRACKCRLDCGWENNLKVYECYGQSGGRKACREATESIIEAIRDETVGEEGLPTLIMGDFNATPNTF